MSKGKDAPRIVIKKKAAKHAAHHGGAWKVAYADFVTAMMALFMVLWLLTQADVKLRSQIAQYFRDPGVLPGGSILSNDSNPAHTRDPSVVENDIVLLHANRLRTKHERDDAARAAEQQELEKQATAVEQAIAQATTAAGLPDSLRDQVIVEVTPAGLTIQVVDKKDASGLLFDVSSAALKPALVTLLARIAAVLREMPNPIQVGGHTDSRPYADGSPKTNWELSFERADAARRVLESNGLRGGQVRQVVAYADSRPLVEGDPLAAENRRLSIVAEREAAPPDDPSAGAPEITTLPPDPLPQAKADAAPSAARPSALPERTVKAPPMSLP